MLKRAQVDCEVPYVDYESGNVFKGSYAAPKVELKSPVLTTPAVTKSISNFYGPKPGSSTPAFGKRRDITPKFR